MKPMSAVHYHRRIQHLRQERTRRRIVGRQGFCRVGVACDVDVNPEPGDTDDVGGLCPLIRPKRPLRDADGVVDIIVRLRLLSCRLRDLKGISAGNTRVHFSGSVQTYVLPSVSAG